MRRLRGSLLGSCFRVRLSWRREAIQIATGNVVIDGNPATRIADIRKVKRVFKEGAAYDTAKLLDSVRGQAGVR